MVSIKNLFKMKKYQIILIFLISVFIFSCSEKYSNQSVQGKINNSNWTCKSSVANEIPSDTSFFDLFFYDIETEEPCESFSSINYVNLKCPKKQGNFNFQNQNITIFFHSENHIYPTNQGSIEIENIDYQENIISGKIIAEIDKNNFINGSFKANYCKSAKIDDFIDEMDVIIDTLMKK